MAGIYIHVPFCRTRCIYCDFYTRTDLSPKDAYVDALCREIALRREYLGGEAVETIYFGGGTPSLLNGSDLDRIFSSLYANFKIADDAEITLEANPDDLSQRYAELLGKQPFNRLSIGIQSFDDNELKFLNRRHSAREAIDAVNRCKSYGFDNISIDLMYGLPNQTIDIWKSNLNTALSLEVQHISPYHLIYEEDTKLYKLFTQRQVRAVDEEVSLKMFSDMIEILSEAGFRHYEISNFAQEGYISQHNSSYWLGKKYLGLGPAAHSFDTISRSWNIASVKKYIEGIIDGVPNIESENLDKYTQYNEYILTGLRTMWGVDMEKLETLFGTSFKDFALSYARKYIDAGSIVYSRNKLQLTRNGIYISDSIMRDLMWVQ
ncbi:radical SAM family heme chaperone HemW [Dysgonomonas sp. 511]|uniref:radical SAM family heme chaperone HemW n=1 Tax=Dysgonomonas sp. 511 TaxID=2302930 RepID=UPI0013D4BC24|nr:radical SAM family heme chaperone HemW [Dysgonomonas sp. 511]NDV78533.1 radical SAM family heme chaperone HemW [Dysgonomonas sp. 511]